MFPYALVKMHISIIIEQRFIGLAPLPSNPSGRRIKVVGGSLYLKCFTNTGVMGWGGGKTVCLESCLGQALRAIMTSQNSGKAAH